MKKFRLSLKIILIFAFMTVFIFHTSICAEGNDNAYRLKELSMFKGVGEYEDGTVEFDLDRAPTRVEALVMLIRSLGKETKALACKKTHPFTDVPAWADGYVSYAYENRLTSGITDTLFGADDPVSVEMYLTFTLRALGYSDGENGDFKWNSPWALAASRGIMPPGMNIEGFKRSDVVNVACSAFFAYCKGGQTSLFRRLVTEGAFTQDQFDSAFANYNDFDNLSDEYKILTCLSFHKDMVYQSNSGNYKFNYIIDIAKKGDAIKASVLVGNGRALYGEDGLIIRSFYDTDLYLIETDAESFYRGSIMKAKHMLEDGLRLEDYFSDRAIAARDLFDSGMVDVGKAVVNDKLSTYGLEYKKMTYEEARKQLFLDDRYFELCTLEAEPCAVVSRLLGGVPHGPYGDLYLVYKPGSEMGEGEIVTLPLPIWDPTGWGRPVVAKEEDMAISEDGLTLKYTFHLYGKLKENSYEHASCDVYNYTVDLVTGEVDLKMSEDTNFDMVYNGY